MTVYVLTSNYINVDSGDYNHEVIGVYDNFGAASKQLEEEKRNTLIDFEGEDYETSNYCEGDMEWSIWHKEYEMTYRCELKISECVVLEDV